MRHRALPAGACGVVVALAVALGGCAQGRTVGVAAPTSSVAPATPSPVPSPVPSVAPLPSEHLMDESYDGSYRTLTMVLDTGRGLHACYGDILDMYPPACGGNSPPWRIGLVGWSWKWQVPQVQRWGLFDLIGQYTDGTFTITGPITPSSVVDPFPGRRRPVSTPCTAPAGGWAPVDRPRATLSAWDSAATYAQTHEGFGAMWVDERNPAGVPYAHQFDPLSFVLNISTTGDVADLERGLRRIWGGALCVSRAAHSAAELKQVRDALQTDPLTVLVDADDRSGQVKLEVLRATFQEQQKLDARFGAGTVRLYGWLEPVG